MKTIKKKNIPAVLLKSHGVFAFGKDAPSAVKAAVMTEDIAKTYWLAMQNGKLKPLPAKEVKKWYYRYHQIYGQQSEGQPPLFLQFSLERSIISYCFIEYAN